MTRTVRSRRAEPASQPLYARVLRLRHLAPSGLLCFVFLEGAVVLGVLLALAELVSWWGVLVLPLTVALMVKFNDLVAGTFAAGPVTTGTATARATVLRPAAMGAAGEPVDPSGWGGPGVSAGSPRGVHGGYPHSAEFPAAGSHGSPAGYPAGVAGGQHGGVPQGVQPAGQVRAGHGWSAEPGAQRGLQAQADGTAGETAVRPVSGGGVVRRPWAEQLDVRQQVAHQAAARRYE